MPRVARFMLMRLLQMIPSIFVIMIVLFLIVHIAPGDPVHLLAGDVAFTPPEVLEKLRAEFGLSNPLHEQLFTYLSNVARGNLGSSYYFQTSVSSIILQKIPITLLLMGSALLYSTSLGIILGVASGRKPYSTRDVGISVSALVLYSIPFFWLGQMLIMIFAIHFRLFPTGGWITTEANYQGLDYVADIIWHLILPVITLGTYNMALTARVTRGNLIQTIRLDYIKTARSKGLDETTVLYRHALKNSMLPVVTLIGLNVGYLLSGALVLETIFAWPGAGSLLVDSIFRRDYPVLLGMFFYSSIFVLVANFVTDIVYTIIDPRIRI